MDIVNKSLNYLKSLVAETVSNAKSGHTGSALGASSILFSLFNEHLRFDSTGLNWLSRDRFVLSAGHASALLYSLLHLFGFSISIDDLKNFRKYGSKTPGHPEFGVVPGVETTTGPLGQGVANAVGMAIAEEKLHHLFPNLISNYTYCFCGDGCLMEGVANEACSLAGTLRLSKLILLYDDNNITIDGEKTIANSENTAKKFEAMGWNTITVQNGNDYDSCTKAIEIAKLGNKPTIIIFKTIIGIGTEIEGTCGVHAHPLSADELKTFKQKLGVTESFFVPEDVYNFCRKATEKNNRLISNWNKKFESEGELLKQFLSQNKPDFEKALKTLQTSTSLAGRDVSSKVLSCLANDTYFFGGTADLGSSTKAVIVQSSFFETETDDGLDAKNIHFGVREHAMGSIANGISLYCSSLNAFDSTFTSFANYMIPALRMRALMKIPVLSIFSHDSIDIGEDGPTHQPIEQLPQLRQIPNLSVFRPGTFAEVVAGFKHFLEKRLPTVLVMSKNKIFDDSNSTIAKAMKGGYALFETGKNPTVEIFATGRELGIAIEVAKGIESFAKSRVISLPCISEFEKQSSSYKNQVLISDAKLKIAIEASNDNVWYKFIGSDGILINVTDFQFSGNGDEVYKKAGFDAQAIIKKIKSYLLKKSNG